MKILKYISEGAIEPTHNNLWLYKGELKYYGTNGWTPVLSAPLNIPTASASTLGGIKISSEFLVNDKKELVMKIISRDKLPRADYFEYGAVRLPTISDSGSHYSNKLGLYFDKTDGTLRINPRADIFSALYLRINVFGTYMDKVEAEIDKKVDKESGKGLSTNDFTNAYKTKLENISEGATKVIVDSKLNSDSTNAIQNKIVTSSLQGKANLGADNKLSPDEFLYNMVTCPQFSGLLVDPVTLTLSSPPSENGDVVACVEKTSENIIFAYRVGNSDGSYTYYNNWSTRAQYCNSDLKPYEGKLYYNNAYVGNLAKGLCLGHSVMSIIGPIIHAVETCTEEEINNIFK